MDTALLAIGFGMNVASGIFGAKSNRAQARAQMAALENEKAWNLRVMGQNKRDVYASNILESWGAGIDPTTGSTKAIISRNQAIIQSEIDFRRRQYDIEIANLAAQSRQKFLGIF